MNLERLLLAEAEIRSASVDELIFMLHRLCSERGLVPERDRRQLVRFLAVRLHIKTLEPGYLSPKEDNRV